MSPETAYCQAVELFTQNPQDFSKEIVTDSRNSNEYGMDVDENECIDNDSVNNIEEDNMCYFISSLNDRDMEIIDTYAEKISTCSEALSTNESYSLAVDAYVKGIEIYHSQSESSISLDTNASVSSIVNDVNDVINDVIENDVVEKDVVENGVIEKVVVERDVINDVIVEKDVIEKDVINEQLNSIDYTSTSKEIKAKLNTASDEIYLGNLRELFKLPKSFLSAADDDRDIEFVNNYAEEIVLCSGIDEDVAYSIALDSFLSDPVAFRHRIGGLAMPVKEYINFMVEENIGDLSASEFPTNVQSNLKETNEDEDKLELEMNEVIVDGEIEMFARNASIAESNESALEMGSKDDVLNVNDPEVELNLLASEVNKQKTPLKTKTNMSDTPLRRSARTLNKMNPTLENSNSDLDILKISLNQEKTPFKTTSKTPSKSVIKVKFSENAMESSNDTEEKLLPGQNDSTHNNHCDIATNATPCLKSLEKEVIEDIGSHDTGLMEVDQIENQSHFSQNEGESLNVVVEAANSRKRGRESLDCDRLTSDLVATPHIKRLRKSDNITGFNSVELSNQASETPAQKSAIKSSKRSNKKTDLKVHSPDKLSEVNNVKLSYDVVCSSNDNLSNSNDTQMILENNEKSNLVEDTPIHTPNPAKRSRRLAGSSLVASGKTVETSSIGNSRRKRRAKSIESESLDNTQEKLQDEYLRAAAMEPNSNKKSQAVEIENDEDNVDENAVVLLCDGLVINYTAETFFQI